MLLATLSQCATPRRALPPVAVLCDVARMDRYCSIANNCFTGATGSRGEDLWYKCQQQMEAETEREKREETDTGGIKKRERKASNPFYSDLQ